MDNSDLNKYADRVAETLDKIANTPDAYLDSGSVPLYASLTKAAAYIKQCHEKEMKKTALFETIGLLSSLAPGAALGIAGSKLWNYLRDPVRRARAAMWEIGQGAGGGDAVKKVLQEAPELEMYFKNLPHEGDTANAWKNLALLGGAGGLGYLLANRNRDDNKPTAIYKI